MQHSISHRHSDQSSNHSLYTSLSYSIIGGHTLRAHHVPNAASGAQLLIGYILVVLTGYIELALRVAPLLACAYRPETVVPLVFGFSLSRKSDTVYLTHAESVGILRQQPVQGLCIKTN